MLQALALRGTECMTKLAIGYSSASHEWLKLERISDRQLFGRNLTEAVLGSDLS